MERIRPKLIIKNEPAVDAREPARPVWLSNTAYFSTAGAISIVIFLLILSFLSENDGGDGAWWLPALLFAAFAFGIAAAVKGVLIRRARHQFLLKQERLSYPLKSKRQKTVENKFTLEQHAAALKAVQKKSESADSVNSSSPNSSTEAHLEALQMCNEYLEQIDAALPTVHAGSPRLAAFRSGQERVKILQKHHLLEWTGGESRALLREAQVRATTNEKIETAQRALEVLESSLQLYPDELQLIESEQVVREFIASVRISHWVELAERDAFKEKYQEAIDHYRDALFYLSREAINENERITTGQRIEGEIFRLQQLLSSGEPGNNTLR